MRTEIRELVEGEYDIRRLAVYTLPPKESMVCYIMQSCYNNYNTWEYPKTIKGMREVNGNYYYDDKPRKRVIAAYGDGE